MGKVDSAEHTMLKVWESLCEGIIKINTFFSLIPKAVSNEGNGETFIAALF